MILEPIQGFLSFFNASYFEKRALGPPIVRFTVLQGSEAGLVAFPFPSFLKAVTIHQRRPASFFLSANLVIFLFFEFPPVSNHWVIQPPQAEDDCYPPTFPFQLHLRQTRWDGGFHLSKGPGYPSMVVGFGSVQLLLC